MNNIDQNTPFVGGHWPDTSQGMQKRALPRSGAFRRKLYDYLQKTPSTDDELELVFDRSHQSVSGHRATLKKDGFVEDSGHRRVNRYGNEAIVWRTPPQFPSDIEAQATRLGINLKEDETKKKGGR